MGNTKRPATKPSMTLSGLLERFPDEAACRAFLASKRWPDTVSCPRCGNAKVATLKARPFHWQCKACAKNGYRFSVTAGTIFENTNTPLRTWFQVAVLMVTAKKGLGARQVQRTLGIKSYETAWYMCHRIRAAMQTEDFTKLSGVVEDDETHNAVKESNKPARKRLKSHKWHGRGGQGPGSGRTVVIGAIAREANVTTRIIEKTDAATMAGIVREVLADDVSVVATDDDKRNKKPKKDGAPHESVNHTQTQYVRGNVNTGTIDGFWSMIMRGVLGSFHHVSNDYLPLYVNEFTFRESQRDSPDMFGLILERA